MMALTRCDTTFHERIAGKYRLGRRVRGRWPSLIFRNRGKGATYGKIFSTVLVRLDFYYPQRESSAPTCMERTGARLVPLLVGNHPFGATMGQQEIRPLSRVFDHLYLRIPGRLVAAHPGIQERVERHGQGAGDFFRGVTGHGTSLSEMTVSRAAAPGRWRVLSLPAHGATEQHLTGTYPGSQPLRKTRTDQRQDALRLPPMTGNRATQLPQLVERLRKRSALLAAQAAPLVQRALARHAGQGSSSIAETSALPGHPLQVSMGSRWTVPAPGIFRQQGEREPAGDELVLNRQGEMARQVEELKRIVVQTRKLVEERVSSPALPIGAEIRKQIDVELISEQVYRAIERRIRQERERRGV